MRVGELTCICTGPEDLFLKLPVSNNDHLETDFETLEIDSFSLEDFYNDEDIVLDRHLVSTDPIDVDVEAGKPVLVTARYQDEGNEPRNYRVVIVIAYVETEAPEIVDLIPGQ